MLVRNGMKSAVVNYGTKETRQDYSKTCIQQHQPNK